MRMTMTITMQKLPKSLSFLLVFALLGAATRADAAPDTKTGYFQIQNLDFTNEGVRVYPTGGVDTNPAGCPYADYYEPYGSFTQAQREVFDKALLGAFLAGKAVKLQINGGVAATACGPNQRPAYELVRLDSAY